MHKASFVVWGVLFGLHVLVYAPRLPRLVFARDRPFARVGLVVGSLLAGGALAAGTYSLAGPWLRHHHHGDESRAAAATPPSRSDSR